LSLLQQDWLTRGREGEWGFGQQKVVQASVQSKGLSSLLLQTAYRAIYLGLVSSLCDSALDTMSNPNEFKRRPLKHCGAEQLIRHMVSYSAIMIGSIAQILISVRKMDFFFESDVLFTFLSCWESATPDVLISTALDTQSCSGWMQKITALVFNLVHIIVADVRRALWWQECAARARAELAAQQRRADRERLLALQRCAVTLAYYGWL
jgi:hypothetical protein